MIGHPHRMIDRTGIGTRSARFRSEVLASGGKALHQWLCLSYAHPPLRRVQSRFLYVIEAV
jgi:hypothetical protein